ncbi:MAG: hypothetical protein KAT15_00500, partial [Bacteroidales bacterium]|nr:hypothetical protein [Bacteroidales bacterium]
IFCTISCNFTTKEYPMNLKKVVSLLLLTLIVAGAFAQESKLQVKVTDTNDEATIVYNVSSSSSSSCNTSDFPVYQGTSKTDVNFSDLKKVIVRHDLPAEDNTNYLSVELITKNGKSDIYEVIKSIRITGKSEDGDFSVKVIDVKTIEILD